MVAILLCHNFGALLAASNCDTALAIHLALLNELLAAFFRPKLTTSDLGLMHLTLPMM